MSGIFSSEQIKNDFLQITEDTNFSLGKYNIKRNRLIETIDNNSIKIEKSLVLLNIYNEYYNTQGTIEDLFNTNVIRNYIEYKDNIYYEYGDEGKSSFIQAFFIKVFASLKTIFGKKKISKDVKIGLQLQDIIKYLIIFIIIFIVLYFIITNSINLFSNQNELGKEQLLISEFLMKK